MCAVYGEHSMSCARVLEWHKRFREGRGSMKDDARPGKTHPIITSDIIAQVDCLIRENQRTTVVRWTSGPPFVDIVVHRKKTCVIG